MEQAQTKPRLNKSSLLQMARRHQTHIRASAYRSHLLKLFTGYLDEIINKFENTELSDAELMETEKDLEAVEAALVHLWITLPYNEALLIRGSLPEEHRGRIQEVITEAKKKARHLRLAHTR